MDSREIQNRNKLDYQRKQRNKIEPPPLLRIGEYHPQTGRYEVLFPNGGSVIAGNKLFNSSTPTGTPVRATQAFGSQLIALDYRNHQSIPLPQEEEVLVESAFKAAILYVCEEPTETPIDCSSPYFQLIPFKIIPQCRIGEPLPEDDPLVAIGDSDRNYLEEITTPIFGTYGMIVNYVNEVNLFAPGNTNPVGVSKCESITNGVKLTVDIINPVPAKFTSESLIGFTQGFLVDKETEIQITSQATLDSYTTPFGFAIGINKEVLFNTRDGGRFVNADYVELGTVNTFRTITLPRGSYYFTCYLRTRSDYPLGTSQTFSASIELTTTEIQQPKSFNFYLIDSIKQEAQLIHRLADEFYKGYVTYQDIDKIYLDIKGGASEDFFSKIYSYVAQEEEVIPSERVAEDNWQKSWINSFQEPGTSTNPCFNQSRSQGSNLIVGENNLTLHQIDLEQEISPGLTLKEALKQESTTANFIIKELAVDGNQCNVVEESFQAITLPKLQLPEGIDLDKVEILGISLL